MRVTECEERERDKKRKRVGTVTFYLYVRPLFLPPLLSTRVASEKEVRVVPLGRELGHEPIVPCEGGAIGIK